MTVTFCGVSSSAFSNDAMSNMLSINDASNLYDQTMELFKVYEKILDLKLHVVKYENVINNFKPTVKSLLKFLEVEWIDNLSEFYKTAENKRIISTFAAILCITYCIFILIGSYNYVHKIYSVGILSQDIKWLPQWVPRMVMPVSYGLMLYRFIEALWKILKGQKVNLGLANEAKDAIETFNIPNKK